MTLTEQQNIAMDLIYDFIKSNEYQIFILKGYAGTGKTTLISHIVNYLNSEHIKTQLMAPTGRAAKVLRTKVHSIDATTIHKGIYEFGNIQVNAEESILQYYYPLRENTNTSICIVDEASMISSNKTTDELFKFGSGCLLQDLFDYAKIKDSGKIIFVGDPMQLPPVTDNNSPALDEAFLKKKGISTISFQLTEVIRQKEDSCILHNATLLRNTILQEKRNQLIFQKKENEFCDIDSSEIASAYCNDDNENSAVICFSNQQASTYNGEIRKIKFPNASHLTIGDKLMVVSNNYSCGIELLNGDFIKVTNAGNEVIRHSAPVWTQKDGEKIKINVPIDFRLIEFKDELGCTHKRYIIETLLENSKPSLTIEQMKSIYINLIMRLRNKGLTDIHSEDFKKEAKNDPFYNALQVKYGYAFTCHKSQGGEWNNVYVDFHKRTGLDNNCLRWKYTAITRARHTLYCANLPNISPMMALNLKPISKSGKIPNTALSFAPVEETPYHQPTDLTAIKAKYWSVANNLKGTDYTITGISHKPYREIYEIESPSGIIRVDALFNGAGMFTRYEMNRYDDELYQLLCNENNIKYAITYSSQINSLNDLYHKMISLCDECEITLTNITEANYKATYYMKSAGHFASLTFNFNGKGFINYAVPLSEMGNQDENLQLLIDKLKTE